MKERLKAILRDNEVDMNDLKRCWGCTYPTAKARIDNPEKIALGKMSDLAYYLDYKLEDFITYLEGGEYPTKYVPTEVYRPRKQEANELERLRGQD